MSDILKEVPRVELPAEEMNAVILRMKRAHGHLGSVIRMMEDGADCEAVLTQLAAVNKALSRGGYAIVATGLRHCLATGEDGAVDAEKLEKLFLALA
jgi:DNA-binding FrmR family transcriptional regulator